MTSRFAAWTAGSLTLLLASTSAPGAGRLHAQNAPSTRATIDQYCIGCHNERTKTADLALDTLDVARAGEHPDVWEKVVRKLRGRMMPPLGRPRPDEKTYDAVVADLESVLDRAAALNPNPGRTERSEERRVGKECRSRW